MLDLETIRDLRLAVVRQSVVVRHPTAQVLLRELSMHGRLPASMLLHDYPEVGLKRWYMLEALAEALECPDLAGWQDNPPEEREVYVADCASAPRIVRAEALDARTSDLDA